MAWCLIKHRNNFTFPLPSYQCLKTFLVTYFVCLKNKLVCRILARRVSDLEEAVQSGQMAAFPSKLLLEGYASSEVDCDVVHILMDQIQREIVFPAYILTCNVSCLVCDTRG
jgi:hypothetical protein